MKIVLIGLGSIGQRHARLLNERRGLELFALRSCRDSTSNSLKIKEIYSWEELSRLNPQAAFITNPTVLHIEIAIRCAEMGCALFIEKPLGADRTGLDKLLHLVARKKLATYVAYNLRFHPVIKKIKELLSETEVLHLRATCSSYLPSWRPEQDMKKSYSSQARLGGGVLLDLSHEVDYTSYLLGEILEVKASFSRRSDLTIDAEDYADILLSTATAPANVHINFLSHIPQRTIQVDGKERSFVGDLLKCTLVEFQHGSPTEQYDVVCDRDFTYRAQLEYFFSNLDNPEMMNNVHEAVKVFSTLMKIKSGAHHA